MDTWATSSVTPQIVCGWPDDPELFERTFPMDLRPQAHDIIRTWLFDTVLRSHLEHDSLPWSNTAISGLVLDPDRKKMSKSKGNVVTPMALLEEHGSDGVATGLRTAGPASTRRSTRTRCGSAGGWRSSCSTRRGSRSRRPTPQGAVTASVDRAMLAASRAAGRRGDPRIRGLRLRDRTAAHRRSSSGASATTTSSWSRADATASRDGRRRLGQLGARPRCRCCCGCLRRSCRSSPRKCGPGGRRARFTRRSGRPRRARTLDR